jgi:hypothetical protein
MSKILKTKVYEISDSDDESLVSDNEPAQKEDQEANSDDEGFELVMDSDNDEPKLEDDKSEENSEKSE